jgi:hypothetical protein
MIIGYQYSLGDKIFFVRSDGATHSSGIAIFNCNFRLCLSRITTVSTRIIIPAISIISRDSWTGQHIAGFHHNSKRNTTQLI